MEGAAAVFGIGTGCSSTLVAIKSLFDTIQRYQDRDKALQRLKNLLEDLEPILNSLENVTHTIDTIAELLRGPIENCGQICKDIQSAMEKFDSKSKSKSKSKSSRNLKPESASKMTVIDWGRMEISRGNLSDGIDILEGYKSTIAIGLGVVNLSQARLTQQFFNEFTDLLKTTERHLQIQLQRIEDRLGDATTSQSSKSAAVAQDLEDESAVIGQCITLCNQASDYLQDLCAKQSPLLRGSQRGSNLAAQELFESQISTQQALSQSQKTLAMQVGHLTSRLTAVQSLEPEDPERERLRAQLESDFETSRQCIELCNLASEKVSDRKIHVFGDVFADEDCDQVVVANFSDLFQIGNAAVKKGSMQWVGSADSGVAKQISADRYRHRTTATTESAGASSLPIRSLSTQAEEEVSSAKSSTRLPHQRRPVGPTKQPTESVWNQSSPSANEVRKRRPSDGDASSSNVKKSPT